MRFYIATGLQNVADHNRLRDALIAHGHEITYDWTTHGSVAHRGRRVLADTAKAELAGVLTSEILFVLAPGGRGTHVELGAGLALGIPIVLIGSDDELFCAVPGTCAFYHHPKVMHYRTMEHLFLLNDFVAR